MSGTGWGYNVNGQCDVPDENDFVALVGGTSTAWPCARTAPSPPGDATSKASATSPPATTSWPISAGDRHGLALRSDGSLAAWGYNDYGQVSDAPAGNDFVAVSGGYCHSLALRSDGSLVSWGYNDDGQVSNTPAGNDFVAISAGHNHSLALRCRRLPGRLGLERLRPVQRPRRQRLRGGGGGLGPQPGPARRRLPDRLGLQRQRPVQRPRRQRLRPDRGGQHTTAWPCAPTAPWPPGAATASARSATPPPATTSRRYPAISSTTWPCAGPSR